jgi:hypothetical protein
MVFRKRRPQCIQPQAHAPDTHRLRANLWHYLRLHGRILLHTRPKIWYFGGTVVFIARLRRSFVRFTEFFRSRLVRQTTCHYEKTTAPVHGAGRRVGSGLLNGKYQESSALNSSTLNTPAPRKWGLNMTSDTLPIAERGVATLAQGGAEQGRLHVRNRPVIFRRRLHQFIGQAAECAADF